MKPVLTIIFGFFALVFLMLGCQKTESPPPTTPSAPLSAPQSTLPADVPPILGSAPIVMPEELKGKWTAVKFLVEDKKTNLSQEYVVNLGGELAIPSSTLIVKAEHFIPDLKIDGTNFTSASSELKNPAVHVRVLDKDREVFNGWLFQLFPSVHPFQHEQFSITLRDSVAKS